MDTNYHAPADGDLFGPDALCGAYGADEPGGVLRFHQHATEVTCTACRTLLLEPTS